MKQSDKCCRYCKFWKRVKVYGSSWLGDCKWKPPKNLPFWFNQAHAEPPCSTIWYDGKDCKAFTPKTP